MLDGSLLGNSTFAYWLSVITDFLSNRFSCGIVQSTVDDGSLADFLFTTEVFYCGT